MTTKSNTMGPMDDGMGSKPIKCKDLSAKEWEKSGTDRRLDESGRHGKEGSEFDKKMDEKDRKAANSRFNGPKK